MFYKIFAFYVFWNLFDLIQTKCNLQTLYPDETTRFVVYEKLCEVFQFKFEEVLKEAAISSPYLVPPALYFKNRIKDKFVNEGKKLSSIADLELILKSLNYLEYKNFRQIKLNYHNPNYTSDLVFD